jgi:hypothetical protein
MVNRSIKYWPINKSNFRRFAGRDEQVRNAGAEGEEREGSGPAVRRLLDQPQPQRRRQEHRQQAQIEQMMCNRNHRNRNFLTSGTGTVTCLKAGAGTGTYYVKRQKKFQNFFGKICF